MTIENCTPRAFICPRRPRSVNAKGTSTFKGFVRDAYEKYCDSDTFDVPIYSRIYYFKNVAHQLDADNLSKPILDALEGFAYQDDSIVELRQSGIVDLTRDDISGFDVSNMPESIFLDFLGAVGSEDHLIYVEIGVLTKRMFEFGNPNVGTANAD